MLGGKVSFKGFIFLESPKTGRPGEGKVLFFGLFSEYNFLQNKPKERVETENSLPTLEETRWRTARNPNNTSALGLKGITRNAISFCLSPFSKKSLPKQQIIHSKPLKKFVIQLQSSIFSAVELEKLYKRLDRFRQCSPVFENNTMKN